MLRLKIPEILYNSGNASSVKEGPISDAYLFASQINLIRTANEINAIRIQSKLAELRLLKLAGSLEEKVLEFAEN